MNPAIHRASTVFSTTAVTLLVVAVALAVPLLSPKVACAAAPVQEECDDLTECVPEGMTVEGCWTCETDLHVWESAKSWCLIGTVTCSSDEGTIDFDFDVPVTWDNVFGDPCYAAD